MNGAILCLKKYVTLHPVSKGITVLGVQDESLLTSGKIIYIAAVIVKQKLVKCYIWSIAFYGAETWTFRAVDQKRLESFEMWCWRRMEKISWTDHVRNEEVFT